MFDVNPDAAKFHFRDLERQVAAARGRRAASPAPARIAASQPGPGSIVTRLGHLSVQAFASALRATATAIL